MVLVPDKATEIDLFQNVAVDHRADAFTSFRFVLFVSLDSIAAEGNYLCTHSAFRKSLIRLDI
jgi:hypothetical protein